MIDAATPVRYPIDFRADNPAHYDQIRSGVVLLSMDALLVGLDGNADRTVDYVQAMYRLADTLRNEPAITSQIVRLASFSAATDSLEIILAHVELSNEQLLQIQKAIAEIRDNEAFIRGLIGYRCLEGILLEERPADIPKIIHFLLKPFVQIQCVAQVESIGRFIDIAKLPPTDRLKAATECAESLKTLPSFSHRRAKRSGRTNARSISHDVRGIAYRSTASAAIAAYRFEQDHDRFPKDLSELVPEYMPAIETDPFDGHPLRYVTNEKGAVIYSIGHDGDDDGGVLPPDGTTIAQDGDIVFRIVAH